jgi:hypothetical protein
MEQVRICHLSLGHDHPVYCHKGYPSTSNMLPGSYICSGLNIGGIYCSVARNDVDFDSDQNECDRND